MNWRGRLYDGFYAMVEPFIKLDEANKKFLLLLIGLIAFGAIAVRLHLNDAVATGTVIGTLLAGSLFLVKSSVQVSKN